MLFFKGYFAFVCFWNRYLVLKFAVVRIAIADYMTTTIWLHSQVEETMLSFKEYFAFVCFWNHYHGLKFADRAEGDSLSRHQPRFGVARASL
jgi:hypothetical protein